MFDGRCSMIGGRSFVRSFDGLVDDRSMVDILYYPPAVVVRCASVISTVAVVAVIIVVEGTTWSLRRRCCRHRCLRSRCLLLARAAPTRCSSLRYTAVLGVNKLTISRVSAYATPEQGLGGVKWWEWTRSTQKDKREDEEKEGKTSEIAKHKLRRADSVHSPCPSFFSRSACASIDTYPSNSSSARCSSVHSHIAMASPAICTRSDLARDGAAQHTQ